MPKHVPREQLLYLLDALSTASYWVTEGGELPAWLENQKIPYAATKELAELAHFARDARKLLAKAGIRE